MARNYKMHLDIDERGVYEMVFRWRISVALWNTYVSPFNDLPSEIDKALSWEWQIYAYVSHY